MANAIARFMGVIAALRAIKGTASPLALVIMIGGSAACTMEDRQIPVYVYAGDADTDTDADTDADTDIEPTPDDTGNGTVPDADGDGYDTNSDCNDANASIYPGAVESCNGMDDDCDGSVDEEITATWYLDADSDGYGDATRSGTEGCTAPTSDYVSNAGDCDDTDGEINPDAVEVCDDADTDENCDGTADGSDATGTTYWFGDVDGDGYGIVDDIVAACDQPGGYVADASDCDDTDASAFPGGTEVCDAADNDCDGTADENDAVDADTWYADTDSDGFGDMESSTYSCDQPSGYVTDSTDCDDTNAAVNTDASESCNDIDDDCDGSVDESSATDADTWYLDRDSDGFGDSGVSYVACTAPGGYVADASDCDDTDASAFPGGTEVCDAADNDCDGTADNNAIDADTWYADDDGDGYGDPSASADACEVPSGYVADNTDCNDASGDYYPGADESDCTDPEDYNCDGSAEYEDDDGDGFAACEDCDDSRTDVNPDAAESCNGMDDDCDGDTDGTNAIDKITLYQDTDGDTFGNDGVTYESCLSTAPSGYVEDGGDCDDADAAFNPGAAEADCTDPNDYNCDGSVGYADDDLDGFAACEDCDDTEATANSGEVEACDGIDNDCDGTVDEDDATDADTWYADDDGDGYGDSAVTDISCDAPSGYVADATDCDDSRGATNPSADEYCNSVDDDCDGSVDESDAVDVSTWYYDQDGDGYGEESTSLNACDAPVGYIATAGDCDDDASGVNPSASESCDDSDTDEDCDDSADDEDDSATGQVTWYVDMDGDGFSGSDVGDSCDQPEDEPTATSTYGDCDEDDNDNYVGAPEVADGEDNDCDGEVDE